MVFRLLERSALLAAVPQAVNNLTVLDANTTAIQLAWLRQTDYKVSYSYAVAARQDSVLVQNDTTAKENYTFSDLTPGTSYEFEVLTVVDVVKSEVKTISSDTGKTRQRFVADLCLGLKHRGGKLNSRNLIFPQNLLRSLMSQSQEAPPTSL